MALTRRAALVERMDAEAMRADRNVSATCFEILCGLPLETQLAAAVHMMKRFLPLHERMRPGSSTPRRVLDDPEAWFRERGRETPLEEDPSPLAESAFAMAFDGLLLARAFRDDPYTLTSGCAYAVRMAIGARADAGWIADAPDLVELIASEEPRPTHQNPFHNVAWVSVQAREWRIAADWLRRPEVVDAADPIDPAQIAALLERWITHEEIITVPGLTGPEIKQIDWEAVDARVEARVAAGDPSPIEQVLKEELARE